MALEKKTLENPVGKGENAGYQHFLLFPHCFLLNQREFVILALFNLSSAKAFNWDLFKNLSFGKSLSLGLAHLHVLL